MFAGLALADPLSDGAILFEVKADPNSGDLLHGGH
jgi:hypothetical protein